MVKHFVGIAICALLLSACGGKKAKQQDETSTTSGNKVQVEWATFNMRYDNPQDSLNNWKYRKDTVCQYIQMKHLDIIGMQEVLHNQLEDLKAGLPEYAAIGVGRDDGKEAGEYSPLFYRKDKFDVLDSNTYWLSN